MANIFAFVATVLTVYGIETNLHLFRNNKIIFNTSCNSTYRLRYWNEISYALRIIYIKFWLQQYLPFTVLKLKVVYLKFI